MYKIVRKTILFAGLAVLLFSIFINIPIILSSNKNIYTDISALPKVKTGLLLGTNKYLANGVVNDFYQKRIEAALLLLRNKKIDKIILSGSHDGGYDEVKEMKKDLIKNGIDEKKIIEDKKGDRTNDSILNAINNGYNDLIIISQRFHLQRAIFLAKIHGYNFYGFEAKSPNFKYSSKIYLREIFSRIKLIFWDIY